MYGTHESLISRLRRIIRKPGFWLILLVLVLITIPHYSEVLKYPAFLTPLMSNLGLTRHTFERVLYLAPIVWAGFILGWRGAFVTSLAALACMLPRAVFISLHPVDALFETGAVFIIGNVLAVNFNALRKERERRTYLAALNQTSSVVSQSLELNQILNSSIENVMSVMMVDAVLVFLLDEETGKLILTAHQGISGEFVQGVDRLKLGEGFNGRVAESGEPLFVENAAQDPRLSRVAVRQHEIHSEIIVPLTSKGKVNGTLCAAMHSHRWFQQEEVELLTAIGNQIGIAVENARLYQQQQVITEELRASEERYRELFENAQDAIWLHDLEGNIIATNRAAEKLTGYSIEKLTKMNVRSFLSEESLNLAGQIRHKLLANEPVEQPYEQHLIKKDGSEVFVQLTTSLVFNKGEPAAFQHIARDVTEQKRMDENLRFYLRQATRAQEEERKRISHELHDDTIQTLVVLCRHLDALASGDKGLSEKNRLRLEELWQQTDNILRGVRRLSQDLRPAALDRLGLLPALEWLASDVTEYSGIETKVNVIGGEHRLTEEVEIALFRITQEALRNVWRHSGATNAKITVEFDECNTRITISDNGKGFELPEEVGDLARSGKLGLTGMQERAQLIGGKLSIKSQPSKGSSIIVELPS
ncbi:PAS domain S-box protein [Chloroflexota bacterium]